MIITLIFIDSINQFWAGNKMILSAFTLGYLRKGLLNNSNFLKQSQPLVNFIVQSSTITLWSICVLLMTFHYLESSTVFQLCKKENLYSRMVDAPAERLTESRCASLRLIFRASLSSILAP